MSHVEFKSLDLLHSKFNRILVMIIIYLVSMDVTGIVIHAMLLYYYKSASEASINQRNSSSTEASIKSTILNQHLKIDASSIDYIDASVEI